MNTIILKRARAIWCNDLTPVSTQRHNIRAWVRSVRLLGNKHILAKKIERVES